MSEARVHDEAALKLHGVLLGERHGIVGELRYERPAYPFGHRLKHCTIGAFAYCNAAGATSAYRAHIGRYAQIGESAIIGPPEHPQGGFTNHPFAYTRPSHMPRMYQLPDFARLAPEADAGPSLAEQTVQETWIGHEAYIGAGSFVRRGVRIGNGALVGGGSVVTHDIPDYAVAYGTPARVVRLRFAEPLVERLLALRWWHYDLAPWKKRVDFSKVEATLAFFEERKALGELQVLCPDSYTLTPTAGGLSLRQLDRPLYSLRDPS